MKVLTGMLMFLTIAVAAVLFSPVSQAATASDSSSQQIRNDCHKGGADAAENSDDSSDQCCEKGSCKCPSGTCSGGVAKISNNNGIVAFISPNLSKSIFAANDQVLASALLGRLKRPPRV